MINISTEINREKLAEIAAQIISKLNPESRSDKRWINAIAKAVVELESNPFASYDAENHSLLICSSNSGNVYSANGKCQCEAFQKGFPCYHRAASRLIQRYVERVQ